MGFETVIKEIYHAVGEDDLKDFSDFLNSTVTTALLVVLCTIVGFKSYFMKPLSCYVSSAPSGVEFDDYMRSYCWSVGTIVFQEGYTPQNEKDFQDPNLTVIAYYQWIPFLLAAQCSFFYLPKLLWRIACHHNHGADLSIILRKSQKLSENSSDSQLFDQIVGSLEEWLFVNRDYRHNILSQAQHKIHRKCGILVGSKRLATSLTWWYMIIKLCYLANAISQLFVMKSMLNMNNWHVEAYTKMWNLLKNGGEWEPSSYFPRVSFCRVKNVRTLGVNTNGYTAQCVLPINILNEKIFIGLFLWIPILIVLICWSTMTWLFRVGTRCRHMSEIKKYLKMRQTYKKVDKLTIRRFVDQFLRTDGLFLLYMIKGHAGDVVTSSIVNGLYQVYWQKYRQRDFGHDKAPDEIESLSLKLEPGGKGFVRIKKPSAPDRKDFML